MSNNPQLPAHLVPTMRDRASAMRLILALLTVDVDAVLHVAGEAKSGDDVDRFILALADEFQALVRKCTTDPVGEVEKWVAHYLERADKLGQ